MVMLFLNMLVAVIIVVVFVLVVLDCIPRRLFIRSVKNKHLFVTGGSSGIGLAIAKQALLQGAHVTLVSRSKSNLMEAAESLVRDFHCNSDSIRCEVADVGDYEAISSAIERSSRWKPIDILICNAGLTRGGYLGDASIQDMDITIRTNFVGVVNALHAALPELKLRSRDHPVSVVIMASLASLFFMYGHTVYTATKYALRGLAEGLRFELLPHNIKVSLICPGFTNTPFLDEADKERDISELLKWVNLYSRKFAESPDSVARHTITAIKTGSFLVTTSPIGIALATLGRGFVPADSLVKWMMELILFLPVRVTSGMLIAVYRSIIRRKHSNLISRTKSEIQES